MTRQKGRRMSGVGFEPTLSYEVEGLKHEIANLKAKVGEFEGLKLENKTLKARLVELEEELVLLREDPESEDSEQAGARRYYRKTQDEVNALEEL